MMLRVDEIVTGTRLRGLDPKAVGVLKESIKVIGLKVPISVRYLSDEEGYALVAGAHRLQACIELGMQEIPVQEEEGSELDARLWEIDENLCRSELTELERGEHLVARKVIYLQQHPETKAGAAQGEGKLRSMGLVANLATSPSFVADTAAKTGLSERSIRRDVQRTGNIAPEVRDEIRATPIADKGVELDALARLTPEKQTEAVAAVKSGDAKNIREVIASDQRVNDAITMIDGLSETERKVLWSNLADRWGDEIRQEIGA